MISPFRESIYKGQVALCKKNGVARIPAVFSKEEVNKLRACAVLSMIGSPSIEIRQGFPTVLYNPGHEYFQEIKNDPRLLEIVRLYYGHDNFNLETHQYYFHLPGDPDEFAWHTDERFRPGVANRYLQTAILVDDWTEENSAVEFIYGSHKKPFTNEDDLRIFKRKGRKGIKVLGKAGDVFTWSNTVVHGSEKNLSATPRQYLMHGFGSNEDSYC